MSTDSLIGLIATSGFRPKQHHDVWAVPRVSHYRVIPSNGHRHYEYLRYFRPLTAWNHSSQQFKFEVHSNEAGSIEMLARPRNRRGRPLAQHAWMLGTGSFAIAAPFTHNCLPIVLPRVSRFFSIYLVLSPSINYPTVKDNCPDSCLEPRASVAQLIAVYLPLLSEVPLLRL